MTKFRKLQYLSPYKGIVIIWQTFAKATKKAARFNPFLVVFVLGPKHVSVSYLFKISSKLLLKHKRHLDRQTSLCLFTKWYWLVRCNKECVYLDSLWDAMYIHKKATSYVLCHMSSNPSWSPFNLSTFFISGRYIWWLQIFLGSIGNRAGCLVI